MNSSKVSRRAFVGAATLSSAAVLVGLPEDTAAAGPMLSLDLSEPEDNVFTLVKIQGDVEGKTVYPWSQGEIYGVVDDEMAVPMFKYQSCRVGRYFRQPDGSFVYRYRGMIFYQDFETGDFLNEYHNPFTGKTVPVKHWRSSVGEYSLTLKGPKSAGTFEGEFGAAKDAAYVLPWVRLGDRIWVSLDERVRYKRPSDGRWRTDNAILRYESSWSDIVNPELTSARTSSSWQTAIDWFSWLNMGAATGRHMQGGVGTKFTGIDELPAYFVDFAETNYPGILSDPILQPGEVG